MDTSWILYAVALLVSGGACFYTALVALVRMDQTGVSDSGSSTQTASIPPPDSGPKLTRLGRPVQQIQIL